MRIKSAVTSALPLLSTWISRGHVNIPRLINNAKGFLSDRLIVGGALPASIIVRNDASSPLFYTKSPHSQPDSLPTHDADHRPKKENWNNLEIKDSSDGQGGKPSGALLFTLLSALAIAISYADRSNLSTAIIPMANQLQWDASFSGLVLSLFWLGYALTQIIGGSLADKGIGGEKLLPLALLGWSICTGLTPSAAHFASMANTISESGQHVWMLWLHRIPLLLVRVMLGATEGMALPAVHAMIPKYVSPAWRSRSVSAVTAACYLGAVLSNAVSPMLIAGRGWESCFWVFATLPALIWLPLWSNFFLKPTNSTSSASADSPYQTYGKKDKVTTVDSSSNSSSEKKESISTSASLLWQQIQQLLQEKSVWAIIIAQYTQSWGLLGLLSWLPSYFSERFQVPIGELARYTTLPYILQLGGALVAGYLADYLLQNRQWRPLKVRKWLQTVGMLSPAFCLLACVYAGPALALNTASTWLTLGLAGSALTVAAVSCNHLDLSTRSAGTIFALGNTFSSIGGLLAAPISGWMFQQTGSWDGVFALFAMHYVLGAVLYWWLASDQSIDRNTETDAKGSPTM